MIRDKALLLAPMEDITDATYRKVIAALGGTDIMYTEFISSDGLIRNGRKSLDKLLLAEDVRPMGIQIYGHVPEAMIAAAQMAEDAGADIIDINFGCPVKKIANRGAGSGIFKNIPLMLEITKKVVDSVKTPVTVKTRLGWDDKSLVIDKIATQLQDCGIQALTIHGRSRAQMYLGTSDWTLIGKVKANPAITIPIIGNGDIDTPEKAKAMFDLHHLDGIMIGRACVGQPWIFKHIRHYLDTGEHMPEPTLQDRIEFSKKHLAISVSDKGDWRGIIAMRRHFVHYFKGIQNFRETRTRLLRSNDVQEINNILDEIGERFT